jgi:hypothetical protein
MRRPAFQVTARAKSQRGQADDQEPPPARPGRMRELLSGGIHLAVFLSSAFDIPCSIFAISGRKKYRTRNIECRMSKCRERQPEG